MRNDICTGDGETMFQMCLRDREGYRSISESYQLGESDSNWIARVPHVSRLWGVLLVAEFLVILVVVNAVMDTHLHVTDTSSTATCELPSECTESDIEDMECEYDMETS